MKDFFKKMFGAKRDKPEILPPVKKLQTAEEWKPSFKYENDLSDYVFDTWPFKKEFKKALDNKAKEVDFICINAIACLDKHFYSFMFKAGGAEANFHIEAEYKSMEHIWKFLELLAKGENEASLSVPYKNGAYSLLIAQNIDKERIRLMIIADTWLEAFFNEKTDNIEFEEKCSSDYKPKVLMDIILSKRHFLYTFYQTIRDIFEASGNEYIKLPSLHNPSENTQADSKIVAQYLGYSPAKKIDLDLLNILLTGKAEEVKYLLEKGANPNALYILPKEDENYQEVPNTILEEYWDKASPEEEDDIFIEKNRLLVGYGALPRYLFNLFYNERTFYDCNCSILVYVFKIFFMANIAISQDYWRYVDDCLDEKYEYWQECTGLIVEKGIIPAHWIKEVIIHPSSWYSKRKK